MKISSISNKQIVLFSRSYSGVVGGVERLSLRLATSLLAKGAKVHLVSFDNEDAETFFEFPAQLVWHKVTTSDVNIKSSWAIRAQRVRALRRILKEIRPDVFIGFQVGSYLLMRVASIGLSIASVAAERNAPTLFMFIKWGKLKYVFYQVALHFATIISIQFDEYKKYYLPTLRSRIRITPNSVEIPPTRRNQKNMSSTFRILFVGRLTFQKNVEVLLEAVASVKDRKCHITIVGDGPNVDPLTAFARESGLEVVILPFTQELSEHYLNSDVLCLPSRWEGFPNVAAEALAHGLPVIGFEESAGVSSLVHPGFNGELASGNSNAESLAQVIRLFDTNKYDSEEIRNSVREYSSELFDFSWEQTIENAITLNHR